MCVWHSTASMEVRCQHEQHSWEKSLNDKFNVNHSFLGKPQPHEKKQLSNITVTIK